MWEISHKKVMTRQLFFGRVAGFREIGHNGLNTQIARTKAAGLIAFCQGDTPLFI
jgi:hypothetical protein